MAFLKEKNLPSSERLEKVSKTYQAAASNKELPWDLVDKYLPLVKSIVARMRIYFPTYMDTEDIYSTALMGLVSAAQNFDPKRSGAFGAYATLRIRGSLLDELRRIDWMPRGDRLDAKRYRKAVEALEQKLKRPLDDEDICETLAITKQENERLKTLNKPIACIPLDLAVCTNDPESPTLHELVYDATELNSREIVENRELVKLLQQQLLELPKMPQKVLALYYLEGLRLAEIAAVFGITESRVCQIHSQALTLLRSSMKNRLTQ